MTVLDASVALKWFVEGEPLVEEATVVLGAIGEYPRPYVVPELFLKELLGVLARLPGATGERVEEALGLVESLGMAHLGNGHDLLAKAAAIACNWGLSGYDATYVALASLTDGVWLTADARAAAKVREKRLVHVLGC